MSVSIEPVAREDADTLENLMSLYLFEASREADRVMDEDGVFRYEGLSRYWTDAGRYPFFIRHDGRLAGFALVAERRLLEPGQSGHLIAEFFVLPTLRRQGIGEAAARALFDRFAGHWWVAETVWNERGVAFWQATIGRYTNGAYSEERWRLDDEEGVVQMFAAGGSV